MALDIGNLVGYLELDGSDFDTTLDTSEKKAGIFSTGVSKALGAIGAALSAGAITKGIWDVGVTFDDMSNAIAISSGTSGAALDGLVDTATNVGTRVPVEFGAAGDAVANLNTLTGASGPVLEDMAAAVLDASRMLGEDGVANSQAFGKALTQWQIPAEDSEAAMDALFVATQDYGVGLGDLMGHLNTYGPVLQNAGFTMEESAALFGELEAGGIAVSRVMPGLNAAFRGWADEGKNSQEELSKVVTEIYETEDAQKALSIATEAFGAEGAQRLTTAIRNGTIDLDSLTTALDDSAGAVADTSEQTRSFSDSWQLFKNNVMVWLEPLASRVFGGLADAMETLVNWVTTFTDAWSNTDAQVSESGFPGMLQRIAIVASSVVGWIRDNVLPAFQRFGGLLQSLSGPISVVAGIIGTLLIPTFIRLGVQATVSAAKTVAAWAAQAAGAVRTGVVYAAQSAAMVANWIRMGAVAVAQGARVVGTWVLMGAQALLHGARMAAGWVLAMGPVGWVIAGVVGLVALIIAYWDEIVAWTSQAWTAVSTWIAEAWENITTWVTQAIENVKQFVSDGWTSVKDTTAAIWDSIVQWISDAWDGIVNWVTTGVDNVRNFVRSGFTAVRNVATSIWNAIVNFIRGIPGRFMAGLRAIGNLASTMGNWIRNVRTAAVNRFMGLVNWVRGVPGRILNALGNLGSLLLGAGRSIIDGFLNGLRNAWGRVKNFVGGIADWIRNNKGPISYDRRLLTPAGNAIMQGLQGGLEDEMGSLKRTLDDVTWMIENGIDPEIGVEGEYAFSNATERANTARGRAATDTDTPASAINLTINNPIEEPTSKTTERVSKHLGLGATL